MPKALPDAALPVHMMLTIGEHAALPVFFATAEQWAIAPCGSGYDWDRNHSRRNWGVLDEGHCCCPLGTEVKNARECFEAAASTRLVTLVLVRTWNIYGNASVDAFR